MIGHFCVTSKIVPCIPLILYGHVQPRGEVGICPASFSIWLYCHVGQQNLVFKFIARNRLSVVTELTQSLSPQCPYILVLWPSFLLFLLIQFLVNLCNCSCLNRVHVTRVCVHVCTEAHFWVGEWLFIWRACKGDVQYLRSETVMLAML